MSENTQDILAAIKREKKISSSGVRNIFTPNQPIQNLDLFFGRAREVESLLRSLNTPGQHALLYGDRGVGKSSLANIASEVIVGGKTGRKLVRKVCCSEDSFLTVVSKLLQEMGEDVSVLNSCVETQEKVTGKVGVGVLAADFQKDTKKSDNIDGIRLLANSPSWVAEKVRSLNGLFLIDEFDLLQNQEDKRKIAEFIKHLSDSVADLKVLLVGVSDTATDLIAGHPSVQRCLIEIKLDRMTDAELETIITNGEKKLSIHFTGQAKRKIVKVSFGYPHFTHLLALKAIEQAIADDKNDVTVTDLNRATSLAVNDAEGTIRAAYLTSIRSSNSEQYRKILVAASMCKDEEFDASELREAFLDVWNEGISQGTLNNHFSKLVGPRGSNKILIRLAKGVYKFADPRMPSFVRISNMNDIDRVSVGT